MKGFGYLVKEGLKNVWSNRIMSIASICVLISCLVLTGAASLFSVNVSKVVDSVGDSNETKVYIEDGYSQLEAVYIGKDIEKISNVKSAEFYSKDEAIKQYREELGEELFAQMQEGDNPLPDAFIVVMDDLSLYDQTVAEIEKIEGVDSISNQGDIAERLTDISNLVNVISFWVIIALTVISIFIIANTIRATMYSRRFEISIMKSVGATNMFVRIPFLMEGMIIGALSGVVALFGLMGIYDLIVEALQYIVPFTAVQFNTVMWQFLGVFIVAGVFVGMLGGLISISKYLKKEGSIILGW